MGSHRTVDHTHTILIDDINLDPVREELQEEDYEVTGLDNNSNGSDAAPEPDSDDDENDVTTQNFSMREPREGRGLTYKSVGGVSAASGPSTMSDMVKRRQMIDEVDEDEYEQPYDMPWVDKIKPRLAPDWLDFDRDRVD